MTKNELEQELQCIALEAEQKTNAALSKYAAASRKFQDGFQFEVPKQSCLCKGVWTVTDVLAQMVYSNDPSSVWIQYECKTPEGGFEMMSEEDIATYESGSVPTWHDYNSVPF